MDTSKVEKLLETVNDRMEKGSKNHYQLLRLSNALYNLRDGYPIVAAFTDFQSGLSLEYYAVYNLLQVEDIKRDADWVVDYERHMTLCAGYCELLPEIEKVIGKGLLGLPNYDTEVN
ncbi:hypothetical protein [Ktedonospora formicarum]|uniref:Uncharacterized protein n=1 Tax=Ktedonospora formicarum TaxID=2778364 RepID=A0A8J3I304_9CHLR|nr:hypothetical protein [Ktedonospora formicarum]GHO44539.1 hypothetical protein KSX_27020 [Ktedonospora formicarum]